MTGQPRLRNLSNKRVGCSTWSVSAGLAVCVILHGCAPIPVAPSDTLLDDIFGAGSGLQAIDARAGVFVTDASADINLLQRVDLVMKGGTVYKRDGRPVEPRRIMANPRPLVKSYARPDSEY